MMDAEKYDSEEQIREMQCELLRQGIFVDSQDMRAKVKQFSGPRLSRCEKGNFGWAKFPKNDFLAPIFRLLAA
jgi:hypothetical protein